MKRLILWLNKGNMYRNLGEMQIPSLLSYRFVIKNQLTKNISINSASIMLKNMNKQQKLPWNHLNLQLVSKKLVKFAILESNFKTFVKLTLRTNLAWILEFFWRKRRKNSSNQGALFKTRRTSCQELKMVRRSVRLQIKNQNRGNTPGI